VVTIEQKNHVRKVIYTTLLLAMDSTN